MTISKTTPFAIALLLGVTSAAVAQEYRGDDAEEVNALGRVQISLTDAITAAETETSGKALEATLEVDDGRTYYEVDVFAENSIKHVYVDVGNGIVLDVQEDWD